MAESEKNGLDINLQPWAGWEALDEEDIFSLQVNLWHLMQKQVRRFTSGESSSVPLETAHELMKSITFSTGLYLKTLPLKDAGRLLKSEDFETLFQKGIHQVKLLTDQGRKLLETARVSKLDIGNLSYYDTLAELDNFFILYDPEHGAHDIPCIMDYQLAQPVEGLEGIEFINEYLRRLILENAFCSFFKPENIISLLEAFCPDYRGLLINIFDPVFTNALGRALLEEDVRDLNIGEAGITRLTAMVASWCDAGESSYGDALRAGVSDLCEQLGIQDGSLRRYLLDQGKELGNRIRELAKEYQGGNVPSGVDISGGDGDVRGSGGHRPPGMDGIFLSFKY